MKLPRERTGHAAPAEALATRRTIADAAAGGAWRTDPPALEENIGGVRCLLFDAPGATRATVLHFHGGAFRVGQPEQVARFAAALAARCGVRVICPAYRLAPEHPFPAALVDARRVLLALAGGRVLLSGDSAGGGLAAGLALLSAGEVPLAGLVLVSAWLDMRADAASYVANAATDPLFSREAATAAARLYLQSHPADDPLVSPLLGDAGVLPPTFVAVGDGEVLLDDARGFHHALAAAGVAASLEVVPGMEHVAVTRDLCSPGAAQCFDALARFVDAHA